MYEATIYFEAYEDIYDDGQQLQCDNSWNVTLTAETKAQLKSSILDATYTKVWGDVSDDQLNDYPDATEYHTTYLANAENELDASDSEIEAWKKGECRLWAINCHILVSKITKEKAIL